MALVLKDRVKQDTTTAGTGTITLSGTYLGYQSFSAIGNGNTTYYCIAGQGTNEWEVGIGTYTAAGTTLSRDTILASSNAGSAVPFSAGTKDVFVVYPAGKSVYQDASGNVGIGTTSPGVRLDVVKASNGRAWAASADDIFSIENNGTANIDLRATDATGSYIMFSDTTNRATGWIQYDHSTNFMAFRVNAGERIRIDNGGNVGIGTASPNGKLDVSGGYSVLNGLRISGADTTNTIYQATGTLALSTGSASGITFATNLVTRYSIDSTGVSVWSVGGSERMRLDSSGNLGIGTSSPGALLHLNSLAGGGDVPRLRFTNAGTGAGATDGAFVGISNTSQLDVWNFENDAVRFGTNNTERMRLDASGNLGIGTASPLQLLHLSSASTPLIQITYQGVAASQIGVVSGGALSFGLDTSNGATERMRLDASGNLGLGVTPSAWGSGIKSQQIGNYTALTNNQGGYTWLSNNAFYDTAWKYLTTNRALYYAQDTADGGHKWYTAPSGTAGNAISFTQAMTLDASGNLGIAMVSAGDRVSVGGAIRVTQDGSSVGVYLAGGLRHTGSSNFYIDSNTGGAAGNIIFRNGSGFSEQMRLDSSGNLGVGTASPSAKVHSYIASGANALLLESSANLGVYARWKRPNREYYLALDINNNGGNDFTLYDATAAAHRWTVDSSGNLGLGVTPSAWSGAISRGFDGLTNFAISAGGALYNVSNAFFNGTNWIYKNTDAASYYIQTAGTHQFFTAPSGTAGTAIGFTQAMTLNASGNLGVGTASPAERLDVFGQAQIRPVININGSTDWFAIGSIQEASNFGVGVGIFVEDAVSNKYAMTFGTKPNSATAITERMRLDSSGNLGLGVTPSAWASLAGGAFQNGGNGALWSRGVDEFWVSQNVYNDGSSRYVQTRAASAYQQSSGSHVWYNAPSGTAGNAITFTQAMTLNASGNLGIGTASPVNKLQVVGSFGRGAPVTKTGNFTLADTENWIICNGTGTITVTLPAASSWTGREFTIKTIAAFTVISNASNVVPLAGGAAGTDILAATAGTWATLVSDGTNWIIMQA